MKIWIKLRKKSAIYHLCLTSATSPLYIGPPGHSVRWPETEACGQQASSKPRVIRLLKWKRDKKHEFHPNFKLYSLNISFKIFHKFCSFEGLPGEAFFCWKLQMNQIWFTVSRQKLWKEPKNGQKRLLSKKNVHIELKLLIWLSSKDEKLLT